MNYAISILEGEIREWELALSQKEQHIEYCLNNGLNYYAEQDLAKLKSQIAKKRTELEELQRAIEKLKS